MKILLVHNYYRSVNPSGENMVFDQERSLLELHGHEVEVFNYFSDNIEKKNIIGKMLQAFSIPWNHKVYKRIKEVVSEIGPDVIHVHNTFPMISPSIFFGIKNIPCVLTLHNYRIFCSSAVLMRDGKICTKCIDRGSVVPSLLYGCYRKSRILTIPLAASILLHKILKTWKKQVDAFIVFSEFQKKMVILGGCPKEKIHIKPNYYPDIQNNENVKCVHREKFVLFVGRLSEEKGVKTMIKAWLQWDDAPKLHIVGDGPLRSILESKSAGKEIYFHGQLNKKETQKYMSTATLLLIPSECYEGFPMVLHEAFFSGTPVIASNLGSLPQIVKDGENGLIFDAGSEKSLIDRVEYLINSKRALSVLSKGARLSYESLYNQSVNYNMLLAIYKKVIINKK
jgi:glycosyltransferase involved in cell wall biosynthesis